MDYGLDFLGWGVEDRIKKVWQGRRKILKYNP